MAIFQWQDATSGIRIDVYDDLVTIYCQKRSCNKHATWQIRHVDMYDGFWRQSCDTHIAYALTEVIERARIELAGMGEPSWKK